MKRHALFVGVSKYSDPTIQDLAYPEEDAAELASVFRRLLKFDRVEKLINPAHSPDVEDAVESMIQGIGPGDLFLFFFAGHGFRVKENHVLVCAKDKYAKLEDEYAGLPVGLLKKIMRGPWNRMLVLDACQNDIRATRGADCGVASRDLELIHTSDEGVPGSGFQIVVTACSEGQKALEVSDLGHGLFTSAFLDSMAAFVDARRRIDLESLRTDLGNRMSHLISQYRLFGKQEPMFTMPADAGGIVLLDGTAPMPSTSQPPPAYHQPATAFVVCPVCGKHNLVTDTFKCRVCGKDHLCMSHFSAEYRCCEACVESAQNEGQRLAQEMYDKGENYYYGRNGVGKDFTEAAKWYRKSAEKGHVGAQYCVGYAYEAGEGVVQDYVEAYKWFVKAAEKGHAKAQRRLGALYYNGDGVEQDYCMALQWFRKAAEQGDAFAQANLGVMYCNGQGVEQDDEEAVVWFRKSAEQGDDDAQSGLGFMYDTGRGVAQDYGEAVKWYRKAADQGHATAQCNLGFMYDAGRGVAQDYGEAVKWYRKAAEQGDAIAQYNLGVMYDNGQGVEQDYGEAVKWYRKAAKLGNSDAQRNMGLCYTNGKGVSRNDAEAAKWFRKAAEQGNENAQFNLGECYENGDGVQKDYAKALTWYLKAAVQEHDEAREALQQLLSEMYESEDDADEAEEWCAKILEEGDEDEVEIVETIKSEIEKEKCSSAEDADTPRHGKTVTIRVVSAPGTENGRKVNVKVVPNAQQSDEAESAQSIYEQAENCYRGQNGVKEDRAKAFELYQKAAEQGHADAQYSLGYMYAYGECTAKDEEKALFWYRQAAAQGHEKAGRMATGLGDRIKSPNINVSRVAAQQRQVSSDEAYEKGKNYYYGRNGFKQSFADAVEWFRFAAESGHLWAQCYLGTCYMHGEGVSRDEKKAVKWYRRAADAGNDAAQCFIANCYIRGQGVCKNDEEAVKWYRKAANEGNVTAQCNLGNCYYLGKGVALDYIEAVEWYRRAVAKENAIAQNCLGICYEKGQGVTQDYSEAANLYRKAIANGNERAKESLERVEQKIAASSKTKTMCISSDLVSRDTSSKAKTIRIPSWGDCGDVKLAVVLDDCGNNKIAVIKEIRAIKGVGLAEAVKLIEAAPVAIVRDVAMSECKRIVEQLEKAGARVHYARTLGNALRCARLAKGYSVEQLAAKAKILKEVVQELENDDFHRITTPIYGRGFVKLYAECVGLDPKPLVEMFMAEYNAQKS